MAKTRPALGAGPKVLESFGTGDSERFGTECPVPNSLAAAAAIAGRPPVMNDLQLIDLARRLNRELGRPPKADELIHEAGGCQRKRALAALQTLRLELAQHMVRSQLLFPPSVESRLRELLGDWLTLAAEHLAQRQADFAGQVDERLDAAQAHHEELQARVTEYQRRAVEAERTYSEQAALIQQLTTEHEQLRRDRAAIQAVAQERQRVIDQLVLGTAGVTSAVGVPS